MSAIELTFRGPGAFAEVFVSLLEKENLTVAWTNLATDPTAKVDLTMMVATLSSEDTLLRRLRPVTKRFRGQFPRISIEFAGSDEDVFL